MEKEGKCKYCGNEFIVNKYGKKKEQAQQSQR